MQGCDIVISYANTECRARYGSFFLDQMNVRLGLVLVYLSYKYVGRQKFTGAKKVFWLHRGFAPCRNPYSYIEIRMFWLCMNLPSEQIQTILGQIGLSTMGWGSNHSPARTHSLRKRWRFLSLYPLYISMLYVTQNYCLRLQYEGVSSTNARSLDFLNFLTETFIKLLRASFFIRHDA